MQQAEINLKYDSYIEKEMLLVEKMNKLENLAIIDNFNYDVVSSLSFEGREKLKRTRPSTIGQASRISGVSPSDISVLMLYIGR
ncbi:tRNA uridine 5-carboxymethylaminomethyl modification enzyme MnmG [compost metagenome]